MEKGIENLKNALTTLIKVGEQIDAATSDDGKISLWEGTQIGFKAIGFVKVFKNAKEIKAEYLDLDSNEKQELISFVTEELDISNDVLEEKIEQIFSILIQLNELIKELTPKGK